MKVPKIGLILMTQPSEYLTGSVLLNTVEWEPCLLSGMGRIFKRKIIQVIKSGLSPKDVLLHVLQKTQQSLSNRYSVHPP